MHRLDMLTKYFRQDLGRFYGHAANRLMLYPFIFSFFLVECASFWLLYMGPAFVREFMAFTTVYSLHKAGVYTICILGADMAANHLAPSRGSYLKRTVGQQWLIWSLGLAIGFLLQKTMIRSLILLYAPEVVDYFRSHPEAGPGTATLLMILIPYWAVVVFLTLRLVRSRQGNQQLAEGIMISPGYPRTKTGTSATASAGQPEGRLKLEQDNGDNMIALADITHVTVEDHYCRINFTCGDGLKSTLIRLTLKQMLSKLPREHFLQIHRSHVVNRAYIRRLTKIGRDHKVGLRHVDVALPVGRSRVMTVQSWLEATDSAGRS